MSKTVKPSWSFPAIESVRQILLLILLWKVFCVCTDKYERTLENRVFYIVALGRQKPFGLMVHTTIKYHFHLVCVIFFSLVISINLLKYDTLT